MYDKSDYPIYPDLPSVKKHRKAARDGLTAMTSATRRAYGEAVENAIKAKQRSELQRELPTHNVSCASGTNHSCGHKISAAIRAQHRAALLAWPSRERAARSPAQWQAMYDAAMKTKLSLPTD